MANCPFCLLLIDHVKSVVTTIWKCSANGDALENMTIGWKCPNCGAVLFSGIEQEYQVRVLLET